jgi:hypothetical protein
MTLASCAAICTGYTYFGVEYGIQCFCGTALDPSGVTHESQGLNRQTTSSKWR